METSEIGDVGPTSVHGVVEVGFWELTML